MVSNDDVVSAAAADQIAGAILVLRNQNVLLDGDLAPPYGVTTKRLNEQVRRNRTRFPDDFMFQLSTVFPAKSIQSQEPECERSTRAANCYSS
jgi:hypothetical protein